MRRGLLALLVVASTLSTAPGEQRRDAPKIDQAAEVRDDFLPPRSPPQIAATKAGSRPLLARTRPAARSKPSTPPKAPPAAPGEVEQAIRAVFGQWAEQALKVSWCESRYKTTADNGQYENIFQMGLSERKKWGWHVAGDPPILAAKAAFAYFAATGFDWSPWESVCRP